VVLACSVGWMGEGTLLVVFAGLFIARWSTIAPGGIGVTQDSIWVEDIIWKALGVCHVEREVCILLRQSKREGSLFEKMEKRPTGQTWAARCLLIY
jgi:hypothetical protein